MARTDLGLLLNEVKCSDEGKVYLAIFDRNTDVDFIQYQLLWAMFVLGTVVLATPYNHIQAFVAAGYTYARPSVTGFEGQHVREGDVPGEDEGSNGWFQLYCWYHGERIHTPWHANNIYSRRGYDGEYFRRVPLRYTIPGYLGKKKITALPCFPMDYEENKEVI